jgi:putative transposase
MVGDWDKRQTLADTGIPFVDKRINRQVQNNNPLRKLIGYLKYKAHLSGREVEIFDERGTTRTCSKCDHAIAKGVSPSVRTFLCPKCGFSISRDINSTLNFLKQFQYALWQGLQGDSHLVSIVRTVFNPSSGKNRTPCSTEIILNYQDARCL